MRQAGKGGVNRAERGILIRTLRPPLYRMQAMVFRRDPLVAHIRLPILAAARRVPKSDDTTLFRFLRLNQFFPKGPHL